jgi:hypothetical protein
MEFNCFFRALADQRRIDVVGASVRQKLTVSG